MNSTQRGVNLTAAAPQSRTSDVSRVEQHEIGALPKRLVPQYRADSERGATGLLRWTDSLPPVGFTAHTSINQLNVGVSFLPYVKNFRMVK